MRASIYIQFHRFFAMIDHLHSFIKKPLSLLRLAGRTFRDDIEKAQFARSGEPRWPDLSPAYKKQKRKRYGRAYPILTASGAMRRGFKYEVNLPENEVLFGSPRTVGKGRYNLLRLHQVGAGNLPRRNAGRIRGAGEHKLMDGAHNIIARILRRAA